MSKQTRWKSLVCKGLNFNLALFFLFFFIQPAPHAPTATTVCASPLCDYHTIADALLNTPVNGHITVLDAVHTESGIVINKNMTINGLGMDETIVQAHADPDSASTFVFSIAAATGVALIDMTVRHGKGINGGGIVNAGSLVLDRVRVTKNQVTSSAGWVRGGGIYSTGLLWIWNGLIDDNLAAGTYGNSAYGGGIFLAGTSITHIYTTTISSNSAIGGDRDGASGGGAFGGGIYDNQNDLDMYYSTIDNNLAMGGASLSSYGGSASGGGLMNLESGGAPMTIIGSTISGNRAIGGAGAISNGDAWGGGILAGNCSLVYSTVVSNSVAMTSTQSFGGGFYGGDPVSTLLASIIANNSAPSASGGPDLFGSFASQDYNLIESTQGYVLSGPTTQNLTGVDPKLGPLAVNSGKTQTHALLPGSPAIEYIPPNLTDCISGVSRDQRAFPRADGAGRGGEFCDIGAYEYGSYRDPKFIWLPVVTKFP